MHKHLLKSQISNIFKTIKLIQMSDSHKSGRGNTSFQSLAEVQKDQTYHQNLPSASNIERPSEQKQQFHEKDVSPRKEELEGKEQEKKMVYHRAQSQGYNVPPQWEEDQFQSQSEVMQDVDLLIAQKKKLKIDGQYIEDNILKANEDLLKLLKAFKLDEEKEFQLGLQNTRIQNIIQLVQEEYLRLAMRKAMSSEEQFEISKEINRICETQIKFIQRHQQKALENVKDEAIQHIFENYFQQLQPSEDKLEKQLRTFQKDIKIKTYINMEKYRRNQLQVQIQIMKKKIQQFEAKKQKRDKQFEEEKQKRDKQVEAEKQKRNQILNLLNEKKVQQFQLLLKLKDAKNEDKEEIEVNIFKVSLDIKNLENKQKELQNSNYQQAKVENEKQAKMKNVKLLKEIQFKQNQICKSNIQIEWENLEKKILQMKQFYQDKRKEAVDQRQRSFICLAECVSLGNNVIIINSQKIKQTIFFKQYSCISHIYNKLSQIKKFFEQRKKLSQSIQSGRNVIKIYRQEHQKNQNQLKQVEARMQNLNLSNKQKIPFKGIIRQPSLRSLHKKSDGFVTRQDGQKPCRRNSSGNDK